jgi:LAS superfamily LD-carboxypeptidase LdcB
VRGARLLIGGSVASLAVLVLPASGQGAVAHTVEPGETLWSIAAASNLTTRTVAAHNGLDENASVAVGETIEVPSEAEGAAALASAGAEPAETATETTATTSSGTSVNGEANSLSAPGMAHIPSPWGQLHLAPEAAAAWNAMREESLATYGVDLHPAGTLSAFRGSSEQAQLYEEYQAGGPLAAAPGTSAHETGTAVDLATEEMRSVVDAIGGAYGWAKVESFDEWWHINYVG